MSASSRCARTPSIKPALARAIHELGYGGKTTLIEQESVDEDTALSRLVRACLMYTSWPKDENAEAVQAYARREIVRLERGLVFLEVVTGLGPLLGLMGTILGLIRIFGSAGHADELSTQSTQIAAGIAEAMYCTVAGLIVAIPALIAHSLFSRHIEALTIDLETLCSELLGKLYTQSETPETAHALIPTHAIRPQTAPLAGPQHHPVDRRPRRAAHLLHRHHGLQEDAAQDQHRRARTRPRPRPRRTAPPSIIYVTTDSKIYLDDTPVDPDQLGDLLKSKIAANPDFKVAMKSRHQGALRDDHQGHGRGPRRRHRRSADLRHARAGRRRNFRRFAVRHDPRNRSLRRTRPPRQGQARPRRPGLAEIRKLVDDLFDTMRDARGVGLAAQQIGEAIQVAVIDVTGIKERPSKMWIKGEPVDPEAHMPLVLINPVVKPTKTKVISHEGCLSFPGLTLDIARAHARVGEIAHARRRHVRVRRRGPARPRRPARGGSPSRQAVYRPSSAPEDRKAIREDLEYIKRGEPIPERPEDK